MIDQLKYFEKHVLENLLDLPGEWKSLDIDYDYPHVERVWLARGEFRISLHVIHPVESTHEPLVHGHAWKGAFHVLGNGGIYEHSIWCDEHEIIEGEQSTKSYELCRSQVKGEMYYEMLNQKSRHSVKPLGVPVYSIMMSGKPEWPENAIKADYELQPLSDQRKEEILQLFKTLLY